MLAYLPSRENFMYLLHSFRSLNSVCQKFTPTAVETAPTSHSVEDGSYFPSQDSNQEPREIPPTSSTPTQQTSASSLSPEVVSTRTSVKSTTVASGKGNSQRMPKQDLEEELRTIPDDEDDDVSINFDEFFDLAVTKNQFLNSGSENMNRLTLNLFHGLLVISILLMI